MRILHVITAPDLGGAQSVVAELSRYAVMRGDEAAMASQATGPLWAVLDPRVRRFPIQRLVKSISPADDLAAFLELRRVIKDYRPDILHLHSSKAGVLGRLAAGRLRGRTIYTVHGFDTIAKAHRSFLPLERLLQHLCGAIVAVSAYDEGNLAANGIERKVRMIRNGARDWRGVRPGDEAAASTMEKARAEGGAVLCIARLAPPKRFDLFLEAAARLPAAGFFWIGNETEIDKAKLPPNVTMLGSLPDAGAYATLADLLVLFSDYEGLPMSILEALSCGTPVVASRVGGVGEALDGICGEALPNVAADMALAIARYLPGGDRHAGVHPQHREASRARYEARFSVDAMAKGYDRLYRVLAEEI
jgi:glycosyltransferase involved in cell wall biosynthesis